LNVIIINAYFVCFVVVIFLLIYFQDRSNVFGQASFGVVIDQGLVGATKVPGGKENGNGSRANVTGTHTRSNRGQDDGDSSHDDAGSGSGGGEDREEGDPGDDDNPSDGGSDDDPEDDHETEDDEEEEEGEENEAVDAAVGGDAAAGTSNPSANGNWQTYESLMKETYPSKSKTLYLAAYVNFEKFLKSEEQFVADTVPAEISFLNYFSYLKSVKFWAPTTIWSQYSRLNAVLKRKFGFSLKTYPSITDLLKSYSVGHRLKKSAVFTPQQVILIRMLVLSCLHVYWLYVCMSLS
jgi:hypothetical protein